MKVEIPRLHFYRGNGFRRGRTGSPNSDDCRAEEEENADNRAEDAGDDEIGGKELGGDDDSDRVTGKGRTNILNCEEDDDLLLPRRDFRCAKFPTMSEEF